MCVVYVCDNSKNNGSIQLKLKRIVVYEKSSHEFDIGYCLIKVKVRFEMCYEGVIWHVCSHLRHKLKLLILLRLSDFFYL